MLRGFARGCGSGTPAPPTRVTNRRPSGLEGNVSMCWRRIWTSSGDAGTARVSRTPRCFSWRSSFAWPESAQPPPASGVEPSRTSSPQPDSGSTQSLTRRFAPRRDEVRRSTDTRSRPPGRVRVPDRGQQGLGLSVVHHYPTIDRIGDDRPSQLQLLELIVRQKLKLHRVLEGTEQRCALSGDRRSGGRCTVQLHTDRSGWPHTSWSPSGPEA